MVNRELVISLIKDDLINTKLVNGLTKMGLNAEQYTLHLSSTIFELMGFQNGLQTDVLFEFYIEYTKKVDQMNTNSDTTEIDELAEDIFEKLERMQIC